MLELLPDRIGRSRNAGSASIRSAPTSSRRPRPARGPRHRRGGAAQGGKRRRCRRPRRRTGAPQPADPCHRDRNGGLAVRPLSYTRLLANLAAMSWGRRICRQRLGRHRNIRPRATSPSPTSWPARCAWPARSRPKSSRSTACSPTSATRRPDRRSARGGVGGIHRQARHPSRPGRADQRRLHAVGGGDCPCRQIVEAFAAEPGRRPVGGWKNGRPSPSHSSEARTGPVPIGGSWQRLRNPNPPPRPKPPRGRPKPLHGVETYDTPLVQ